jgi:hypothetical protein
MMFHRSSYEIMMFNRQKYLKQYSSHQVINEECPTYKFLLKKNTYPRDQADDNHVIVLHEAGLYFAQFPLQKMYAN